MEILESYLRPALVPDERWDDVRRWSRNHRFVRWARSEYMFAEFGSEARDALLAYPELRTAPLLAKSRERSVVLRALGGGLGGGGGSERRPPPPPPSSRSLTRALRMRSWSRTKNVDAGWERMGEIGPFLCIAATRLEQFSFDHALIIETGICSYSAYGIGRVDG